jgi:hypothetical protein
MVFVLFLQFHPLGQRSFAAQAQPAKPADAPAAAAAALGQRSFAAQAQPAKPADAPATTAAPVAPGVVAHPGIHEDIQKMNEREDTFFLMQPHYPDKAYLEGIKPFHRKPETFLDRTGYYGVKMLRSTFDFVTGYGENKMNEKKWLTRFLFLETVAGVPGFVGGGLRHLRSLRTMQRDKGWIHTLLEEAENERMHLLTFMEMAKPGTFFRSAVIGTQGVFLSLYTLFYAVSPRHCHSFVSYLEEEAVKTYSHCLADIDAGKLPAWDKVQVPEIAMKYWRLEDGATMRDLILAIRADELCHNHVNEVFAKLKNDDPNPFAPGTTIVA